MTHIGFDADQDCSGVAPLAVTRGVAFCCRYLKNLHAAEAAALSAAGLSIVSIFETTAERALSGGAAGVIDGRTARSQAVALGQPAGSAIYFTADFDVTAAEEDTVIEYMASAKAAQGGAYKLGLYTNGAVCDLALQQGVADYAWLAGGSGMRGTKAFLASGKATIVQEVGDKRGLALGISIDSDIASADDFGGWSLGQPVVKQTIAELTDGIPSASALQAALKAAGLYAGFIDGIFGPKSLSALAAYYRAHP